MRIEPLVILNFGEALTDDLKTEIEENMGRKVEERRIKLSINAVRYTYPQVLKAMNEIDLKLLPPDVVLNLPKLPIAAVFLVNEFFARTGTLPLILELVRDPMELGTRSFGTLRNLQLGIGETRRRHKEYLTGRALEYASDQSESPPTSRRNLSSDSSNGKGP